MPFIGAASRRRSFTLGLPTASWHPNEAAPLEGGGSEAASSKARAVLCSGEPLQHGARHEIKDFLGALSSSRPLSSWPLNWGTLKAGISPVPIASCRRTRRAGGAREQLSDADLMRIAVGGLQTEVTRPPQLTKLLLPIRAELRA